MLCGRDSRLGASPRRVRSPASPCGLIVVQPLPSHALPRDGGSHRFERGYLRDVEAGWRRCGCRIRNLSDANLCGVSLRSARCRPNAMLFGTPISVSAPIRA